MNHRDLCLYIRYLSRGPKPAGEISGLSGNPLTHIDLQALPGLEVLADLIAIPLPQRLDTDIEALRYPGKGVPLADFVVDGTGFPIRLFDPLATLDYQVLSRSQSGAGAQAVPAGQLPETDSMAAGNFPQTVTTPNPVNSPALLGTQYRGYSIETGQ